MSENRYPCGASGGGREMVCIETNRILDSCKDRDCYEDVRVFLTDFGNSVIERTGTVRVKGASIAWVYIGIDPVAFNRGFYTVSIRFFLRICFEACLGHGKAQEFDGVAAVEKRVVLYGGEGSVHIFRSDDFRPGKAVFKKLPDAGTFHAQLQSGLVYHLNHLINLKILPKQCRIKALLSDIL